MQSAEKVRKQFILDPAKIKLVKKITRAATETDAINTALDMVIANKKIEKTLASVRGKGNIRNVYARESF
jgi:hypothetical protein